MRIAIVNDMRMACEALRRAVTADRRHSVAWTALDGAQAIDRARQDRPDLILMDMIMPGIDGVEATRRIMSETPCPILVVTSTVSGNIGQVFDALGHGALDVVQTPTLGSSGEVAGGQALLDKIRRIEHMGDRRSASEPTGPVARASSPGAASSTPCRLVLIGSSTGGPTALATILRELPPDLPAAVVIAQHVDHEYAAGLAEWLGASSSMPVTLATVGAVPVPGNVYLAPSTHHLTFSADRRLAFSDHERDLWYRPSVDILFEGASRVWPTPSVAVLLTGMGRDGANGLLCLRKLGWTTIAQDQASSVVWGMPRAAIELQAATHVLPLPQIAATITASIRRPLAKPARPSP